MKLKKFLSIILVCCLLLTVLSLTACKGGDDDTDGDKTDNNGTDNNNNNEQTGNKTYTVTIVDGDNNPVEGVRLVITDGKTFPTVTTGYEGKASTELPEGSISVMIAGVPDGYVKPEKVSGSYHGVFASGKTELTIEIGKEVSNTVAYTVKVVDQNGDAVEGIQVQLCYDGICLIAVSTDENGEMSKELAPGKTVDVKLYELDGYTLPTADDHGYHAVIAEGDTEITVVVTKN